MEYRSRGNSGLKVPVFCLGAMTFGEADEKSFMHKVGCDEKTSFAIMSRALERGAGRLADSQWISKSEHLHRFVALQMQYSLMVRDLEREHIPLCKQFGLGVLPWSPLASGFLSGKYAKNRPPPPGVRLEKWRESFSAFDNDRGWRVLDTVNAVAKEKQTTPCAVALAWLLAKPMVTSVIFGARSIEQVDDNLKAADVKLGDAEVQKLDDASAFELGYPYKLMGNIQKRW